MCYIEDSRKEEEEIAIDESLELSEKIEIVMEKSLTERQN